MAAERVCEYAPCGAMYTPVRDTQRCCSRRCAQRLRRGTDEWQTERVCEHEPCGSTYLPSQKKQRFCSNSCKCLALRGSDRAVALPEGESQRQFEARRRERRQSDPAYWQRERDRANEWNHGRGRWLRYEKQYGIGRDDLVAMLARQGGGCANCGQPLDIDAPGRKNHFHVDHCHDCGEVRGVLCPPCNTGLGQFRDDTRVMARAIAYLDAHREAHAASYLEATA